MEKMINNSVILVGELERETSLWQSRYRREIMLKLIA
jgi:hypothetical protein